MNRLHSFFTAVLICGAVLCVQFCTTRKSYADYSSSSGFALDSLDARNSQVIGNLGVLCRVWGYVKYHHPVFADDKYNIDYELFELLPQVAHVDSLTRNRVLCEWIDGLGSYDTAPELYDSLPPNRLDVYQTDLSWTHDTARLGQALSERLVRLRYADRRAGNRYVTKAYYPEYHVTTPNAGFDGEEPYAEMTDPDCGYRLLAAFRFWNMVEYFFPYKHLTDKPWSDVLSEYAARMIALPDGSYLRTMWRMIAETNDSHAAITGPILPIFGGFRAPVTTAYVEGKLIVAKADTSSGPSHIRSGFQAGDEIVSVDGLPVDYYKREVRKYIPCSNEARVCDWTSNVILRSPYNTSVCIRYHRDGIERDTLVVVTRSWNDFDREYGSCVDFGDGIVYIDPGAFGKKDVGAFEALIKHVKGLVVDLRYYPQSDEFDRILDEYIVKKPLIFKNKCQCYTYPTLSLPGVFASSVDPDPLWERPLRSDFPVVVLVDNGTQSSGETHVQWLQTCNNVVVVGNQSAGANGNVSYIYLPGGIKTCFSGLGWYYSDGVTVQRRGVRIDVEVHPTVEGVKASRDEILDKALEILHKGESGLAIN